MADWRHRAACRDESPELFHLVGKESAHQKQIRQAKRVCHRCPVRSECLAWALETGNQGICGGTTPSERRALRGSRQRA